jgi:hypothetical protein
MIVAATFAAIAALAATFAVRLQPWLAGVLF